MSGGGTQVSYGELVQDRQLDLVIPVSGTLTDIFGLTVVGDPPLKPVRDYTIVGKSFANYVTESKVRAQEVWVTDVRLPDMLHARVVHPKTLGSTLVSVGDLDRQRFPNAQVRGEGQPRRRRCTNRMGGDPRLAAGVSRDRVVRVEGPPRQRRPLPLVA